TLQAEREKLLAEVAAIQGALDALRTDANRVDAKQQELSDRLAALEKRSSAFEQSLKQESARLDHFRYSTALRIQRGFGHVLAQILSLEGTKRVPLANQTIKVYLQVEDGEKRPIDQVVTDSDGFANFDHPTPQNVMPGTFLVIEFEGDDLHRPTGYRVRL